MYVKIINIYLLSFKHIIHEAILIDVALNGHNSLVIFKIIRSICILDILGLF